MTAVQTTINAIAIHRVGGRFERLSSLDELRAALAVIPCRKPARGETMDEVWVGCGECDVCFPCHNGQQKCLRLPAEPSQTDLD